MIDVIAARFLNIISSFNDWQVAQEICIAKFNYSNKEIGNIVVVVKKIVDLSAK